MRRRGRWRRIAAWLNIAAFLLVGSTLVKPRWWLIDSTRAEWSVALGPGGLIAGYTELFSATYKVSQIERPGFEWTFRVCEDAFPPASVRVPGIPVRRSWYLIVPMWAPLLLLTATSVGLWYWSRPPPRGHCQKCGYDLTGNVSGRCPECGVDVKEPTA